MYKQAKQTVLHVLLNPTYSNCIFLTVVSTQTWGQLSLQRVVKWVGEGGQPVDDLYPLLSTQPSSGTSFDPPEDSRRGACGL